MEKVILTGAREMLDYVNASPTPFHAAANGAAMLAEAGFEELDERKPFDIVPGGRYFIRRNNSSLLAFRAGQGDVSKGFRIIAAHTDSPGFRVKPAPEMETDYLRLNTAPYGRPVYYTWFDRPLSLAGRVLLRGADPFEPQEVLVDLKDPLLVIPSLAIHFNREVNNGVKLNPQNDTLAFAGRAGGLLAGGRLMERIARAAGTEQEDVLDFDLCLYECDRGVMMGADGGFISAGRLDDLWSVYDGLWALIAAGETERSCILFCPDNEEIGSMTAQGADSDYLKDILVRIACGLGAGEEGARRALADSFVISADCAHALHPNHADKSDPTSRPVLGGGPVLKYDVGLKYATGGNSAAVFSELCLRAGVPMQRFSNRSDMVGGGTIGAMLAASLGCPVADMGAPLLAMHSIRELAAAADDYHTREVFKVFYKL